MRIHVVGTSGSGKTTIARQVAERLDLPHTELDAIRHQAGWTTLPDPEFVARAEAIAAEDAWVVDGNYGVVRAVLWRRATHIVWSDLSRRTVMRQVIWRSLARGITKRPMWNGNKEMFRDWLQPDHPIRWAWSSYDRRKRDYANAARADPRWIRLRTRADIQTWIDSL